MKNKIKHKLCFSLLPLYVFYYGLYYIYVYIFFFICEKKDIKLLKMGEPNHIQYSEEKAYSCEL